MKKAVKLKMLSNREYWRSAAPTPAGHVITLLSISVSRAMETVSRMRSWISSRTGLFHRREKPQSPRAKRLAHLK